MFNLGFTVHVDHRLLSSVKIRLCRSYTRVKCHGWMHCQLFCAVFGPHSSGGVGLSLYEIITSRLVIIDLRQADVHLTSVTLMKYCEELTEVVALCNSVSRRRGPHLQKTNMLLYQDSG